MNHDRLEILIQLVWNFLHEYYERRVELNPIDFIVVSDHGEPRLLIDDTSDSESAYIAIEFPSVIKSALGTGVQINPQALSVVCEEISHFFHFSLAATHNFPISTLELETRAEIDRFVCFLHWNDFFPEHRMARQHDNCRELCDTLFESRIFKDPNHELYRNAESLAFHHLKKAFSHCWTRRWLNTECFDPHARRYLVERFGAHRITA